MPPLSYGVLPGCRRRPGPGAGILIAALLGALLCFPLLHQLHHPLCLEPATCPYQLLQRGFVVLAWLGTLALLLLAPAEGRLRAVGACPALPFRPAFTYARRGPPLY